MGFPEWVNAEFDQDAARDIIRWAMFAADAEAGRPGPPSRIPNPDGSSQPETRAEFISRLTRTIVLYLLETGLLVIPDDISQRLEQYLPLQRQS